MRIRNTAPKCCGAKPKKVLTPGSYRLPAPSLNPDPDPLNPDPDPAFQMNPDLVPDPDSGFDDQKLRGEIQLKKIIFF
jgi:hypothetical protein